VDLSDRYASASDNPDAVRADSLERAFDRIAEAVQGSAYREAELPNPSGPVA
jgi:hypothetical protein